MPRLNEPQRSDHPMRAKIAAAVKPTGTMTVAEAGRRGGKTAAARNRLAREQREPSVDEISALKKINALKKQWESGSVQCAFCSLPLRDHKQGDRP